MTSLKKYLIRAAFACLMVVGSLSGAACGDLITGTFFEANFTASEGYSDGVVIGQPGFTDSQTGWVVSDSAGTGTFSNIAGNFERAQFGGNGLSTQTVAIGDMILIEAFRLSIASDGVNDFVMTLGLSDGRNAGAANNAIGTQLTKNGAGDLFVENISFGAGPTNTQAAGVSIGDTFDYGVKLTAETAGASKTATYSVDHLINGVSVLQETGVVALLNAAGAGTPSDFAGYIQDQDPVGGAVISMSSLKISTISAVPEPGSFAMFGIACFALARRRR